MAKEKTELTPEEKIDKFFNWLKNETQSAKDSAIGSASSLLWGRCESMKKVLRKYKAFFKENKTFLK